MRIGILAPMKEEMKAICDRYPQSEERTQNGYDYYYIKTEDKEIFIMKCGVGKCNASLSVCIMKYEFNVDILINCGSAGGMKLGQKPLDIVIGNEFVYTDVDITALGFEHGEILGEPKSWKPDQQMLEITEKCKCDELPTFHFGTIGTSDTFISADLVDGIQKKFNDRIVCAEMEGCAVAHICTKLNIRFIVIRSLSDVPSVDNQSHEKMYDYLDRASQNAALLVSKIIEQL